MTVIEYVSSLDELLNKAKDDVRYFIRDMKFGFADVLQLEITSLGEAGQILKYIKYREERIEEPLSSYEATLLLRNQKSTLEGQFFREMSKISFLRDKETIDSYKDDLRKIEVEMARAEKKNKADWEIYKKQRKDDKNKLKEFALTIPNIKKGRFEAK